MSTFGKDKAHNSEPIVDQINKQNKKLIVERDFKNYSQRRSGLLSMVWGVGVVG